MTSAKPNPPTTPKELPILLFEDQAAWASWLAENHATSAGLWLRIAKKGSGLVSVTYDAALTVALCYGWIDGQKGRYDDGSWLQKFTRRGPKSIWSQINRDKAEALIAGGQMQAAGLDAITRARQDGRWEAAYASQSKMTVPADLQAALDANPAANAFFATLNSANRYAILFRIHNAKKAETRAKRIHDFIQMLIRQEKIYP